MASFSIPLTGLQADSTALNTIANDLANMSTTAFKAQTTNFSDLFYQQIGSTGSGDPIQVGAGTQVANTETDFAAGTPNSTGVSSNVALQGSGFFVVDQGSSQYLTRDGEFQTDASGNLVTSNGYSVMGYPAANGVVNTSAPLTAISIPMDQVQPPQATTSMSMDLNLDATANTASTPASYSPSITAYDSLGNPQTVTVTFTSAGNNTWDYSAQLPASAYAAGGAPAPNTGTITFDSNGNLTDLNGNPVGTGNSSVTLGLSTAATGANPLADGAGPLSITWNLLGSNGQPTISQVAASSSSSSTPGSGSSLTSYTQNGYETGQYQSFSVGSDGTVTVSYSNGNNNVVVGQVALANVTNDQGLQLLGNGNYLTTRASGAAAIGTSGSAGLGTMEDGALEASNVNISDEFSNLIVAQRAFEANAKSVTTFDTVTQDAINMVH
ncbi:MAG TPA: flagellar hook protein FlgE [Terracidiphilus sp.]|nr:flagellar hook protein FlgE [Terracidiphilus sp.]